MKPPVSASPASRSSFLLDRKRVAAIFAAVIFGGSAGALAQEASRPPMLLSSPSARNGAAANIGAQVSDVAVTRRRPVAVDLGILDPRSSKAANQIAVELFDGRVLTLVLDRVEQRGPGNFTWRGKVLGQGASQAILTVVAGQIAGSVVLFDSGTRTGVTYQIQSDANGAASLRLVNPNGFPPDHPSGAEKLLAPPSTSAGSSTAADVVTTTSTTSTTTVATDSGDTIDVMVVYSDQTAAAAGITIGSQIQQAVDRANTAYANSGITTRLRLVHYEPANYAESGDFNTDLNRLTNGSDGYMDNVPTLRNTYGADLVSLFIENGAYCGMAWIGPSANHGFSVVNRGCASGNLTFAHELGHNFGARHDPYVDSSTSPYAYGHGLTNPGQAWRTVMAYNNACSAAGTSCTRIPYFSNPNLTYGNPPSPLGTTSTSDNARVHNSSAVTVAGFRLAATGGCTYALSPTGASIGAAAASGSFSVTAGTGCAWNSASSASWLTIGAGSGTTDSGTLNYSVTANAGPARSATITAGTRGLHREPSERMHVHAQPDKRERRRQRRNRQLHADCGYRLRVEHRQQRQLAHRILGGQRNWERDRRLVGRHQRRRAAQREPERRRGDFRGHGSRGSRHGNRRRREAQLVVAQFRQTENRKDECREERDLDEQRRRHTYRRLVDGWRYESRRLHAGWHLCRQHGAGKRPDVHTAVHVHAKRKRQPVGDGRCGHERRNRQPGPFRARAVV